ncbi:hypothetical protein GALMADRAFT_249290 [Galerina marginata CBS 339.88]|uniref:DUF6533 domain-containing protein n=1 Tax=Galerina marginata (strain CBS 339.88) TaxID=685588 RepID=A0A067SWK7_GALM3|nr:hypothetical protein GALMADRAFT_249290 [Galerina marginata CBS 339.88]
MNVGMSAGSAAIGAKLMFVVRGCAYAAFFLTVWEWATTLNFETLVIWRKGTDNRLRWLYVVSRYVGLLAQAVNAFVVAFVQFRHFTSQHHCTMWYSFQLAVSTTLLLSMDLNLIFRLHALYKGSRRVTWSLVALVVVQGIIVAFYGNSSIRSVTFSDDGGCLPMDAPPSVMYLTVAQIAAQFIIWFMTIYKSLVLYVEHGWMKIPLLSLVARDGFWVFVLFTGLLAGMLSDATNREFGNHAAQLCYVVFPVYVAVVSLSSCRITMNIRTFASEIPSRSLDTRTEHIELTTLFTTIDSIS